MTAIDKLKFMKAINGLDEMVRKDISPTHFMVNFVKHYVDIVKSIPFDEIQKVIESGEGEYAPGKEDPE